MQETIQINKDIENIIQQKLDAFKNLFDRFRYFGYNKYEIEEDKAIRGSEKISKIIEQS